IFTKMQPDFSATQTVWRRGRDLNPRYPFRYVRFRGGSFQPLTHLSAPSEFFIPILSGAAIFTSYPVMSLRLLKKNLHLPTNKNIFLQIKNDGPLVALV